MACRDAGWPAESSKDPCKKYGHDYKEANRSKWITETRITYVCSKCLKSKTKKILTSPTEVSEER